MVSVALVSDWGRGRSWPVRLFSAHFSAGRWYLYAHVAVLGFAVQVETEEAFQRAWDREKADDAVAALISDSQKVRA